MNAPSTITASDVASDDLHLRLLASAIIGGDLSGLPRVEWEFYGSPDWIDAANYCADADDVSDLRVMIAREQCFQGWMRLSERQKDEWVDFGNYWAAHKGAIR